MVSSLVLLPLLTCLTSAQLPVPGTIPGLSLDQQFAYIQQLQDHLNTQVQWAGRGRGVFLFLEPLDLFPGLLLRLSGINNNLLKLLWLEEERREHFLSLEPSLD
eukprot:TRINITY_DN4125_c0_g1_i5.p1 TRINITY_DN4125_c0_g1~~TRINITY_DN4125_c0_g1_i5.p1  ORF type:complete len:104 (-),score=34.84 TRINITY_DN4125_c0_g1_i5:1-312(-)